MDELWRLDGPFVFRNFHGSLFEFYLRVKNDEPGASRNGVFDVRKRSWLVGSIENAADVHVFDKSILGLLRW